MEEIQNLGSIHGVYEQQLYPWAIDIFVNSLMYLHSRERKEQLNVFPRKTVGGAFLSASESHLSGRRFPSFFMVPDGL